MAMEYLGLSDINGPLVAVDGVKGVGFEEMVEMKNRTGTRLAASRRWKASAPSSRCLRAPAA